MDIIPKFLASAFVIMLAVFMGISLIISGSSVVSARSFYSNVADMISSVDEEHEANMIRECSLLAEENGYVLTTNKIVSEDDQYYYEMVLKYKIVAPFFGAVQEATVSGYIYPGMHINTAVASAV